MCGFYGIIAKYQLENINQDRVSNLLRHRGPDDQGVDASSIHLLGHLRLAIIDLSLSGRQPVLSPDKSIRLVFNGEIYNYVELRRQLEHCYDFKTNCDTEVLLAAYVLQREHCLKQLQGMFAFAAWDTKTETLFIARDRIGEKPLYYWFDQNYFCFASELKALLALIPYRPDLDFSAFDEYLRWQYVVEPRTPFKGVHKLPAGHWLSLNRSVWEVSLNAYWSLKSIPSRTGDPIQEIRSELENSIQLQLRSDVPVGIALSGGLDSGGITAIASRFNSNLQAFSVGYPDRPPFDERTQAETLAHTLDIPFYSVELTTSNMLSEFQQLVRAMDEPIGDMCAYSSWSVARLAASHGVKVLLSGFGGDEVFWGYDWLQRAINQNIQKQALLKVPGLFNLLQAIAPLIDHRIYRRLAYSFPIKKYKVYLEQLHSLMQSWHYNSPKEPIYAEITRAFQQTQELERLYTHHIDYFSASKDHTLNPWNIELSQVEDIPQMVLDLLFKTWLVSDCLTLADRVSMAASVELRLPLLDYRFIETVIGFQKSYPDFHLPPKTRLRQVLTGVLPDTVLQRPKRGFEPPVHEWIDAIINTFFDIIRGGILVKKQWIHIHVLEEWLQSYRLNKQRGFLLYKLILFELWYQELVGL
ncbi:asparagine synthase (glutamine-hydrolyzing) [Calothrix membranacea FACHB-236]|nr:asparagine synthase (glutamine-hydrolyzing) [Calothrix membranacea FACHB-236]